MTTRTTTAGRRPPPDGPADPERQAPGLLLPPCPPPAAGRVAMRGCDVPATYREMVEVAQGQSRSDLIPAKLRKPENLISVMFIARALNIPFAAAWQNVYATERGDVGERSRLLHALARRAGHRLKLMECTSDRAVYRLWLQGDPTPADTEFTALEAQQLGLFDEGADLRFWRAQPANMLRNRCLTRAVDWHCPEVKVGADFNEDGVAVPPKVADLADGGDQVGPEMAKVLREIGDVERGEDPHQRYVALRRMWETYRLLLPAPAGADGVTLELLLGPKIAAAAAASDNAGAQPSPPAETAPAAAAAGDADAKKAPAKRKARKPRAAQPLPEGQTPDEAAVSAATTGAAGVRMACGCGTAEVMQSGHRSDCPQVGGRQ